VRPLAHSAEATALKQRCRTRVLVYSGNQSVKAPVDDETNCHEEYVVQESVPHSTVSPGADRPSASRRAGSGTSPAARPRPWPLRPERPDGRRTLTPSRSHHPCCSGTGRPSRRYADLGFGASFTAVQRCRRTRDRSWSISQSRSPTGRWQSLQALADQEGLHGPAGSAASREHEMGHNDWVFEDVDHGMA